MRAFLAAAVLKLHVSFLTGDDSKESWIPELRIDFEDIFFLRMRNVSSCFRLPLAPPLVNIFLAGIREETNGQGKKAKDQEKAKMFFELTAQTQDTFYLK